MAAKPYSRAADSCLSILTGGTFERLQAAVRRARRGLERDVRADVLFPSSPLPLPIPSRPWGPPPTPPLEDTNSLCGLQGTDEGSNLENWSGGVSVPHAVSQGPWIWLAKVHPYGRHIPSLRQLSAHINNIRAGDLPLEVKTLLSTEIVVVAVDLAEAIVR